MALSEWVRPIAYCEIDPYCQGVLLSRITNRDLGNAPIWDDIRSLDGKEFCNSIDIIFGGFPCQDISVAGHGKGLEGERSGLFFEIVRLAKEIEPQFLFLENVPAITSRGGLQVIREITEMGYDCRWCVISAASVGALHLRERWFLLANSKHARRDDATRSGETPSMEQFPGWSEKPNGVEQLTRGDQRPNLSKENDGSNPIGYRGRPASSGHKLPAKSEKLQRSDGKTCSNNPQTMGRDVTYPPSLRRDEGASEGIHTEREAIVDAQSSDLRSQVFVDWENTEPPVCGVAHGLPHRVDRIRALGNSVVIPQAKEAFKILMGIK